MTDDLVRRLREQKAHEDDSPIGCKAMLRAQGQPFPCSHDCPCAVIDCVITQSDTIGALLSERDDLRRKVETLREAQSLVTYILQDDLHNRLTPRVIDIAYTAFMRAKDKNDEDGGDTDWFNDTRPLIIEAIAKVERDVLAALEATNDRT